MSISRRNRSRHFSRTGGQRLRSSWKHLPRRVTAVPTSPRPPRCWSASDTPFSSRQKANPAPNPAPSLWRWTLTLSPRRARSNSVRPSGCVPTRCRRAGRGRAEKRREARGEISRRKNRARLSLCLPLRLRGFAPHFQKKDGCNGAVSSKKSARTKRARKRVERPGGWCAWRSARGRGSGWLSTQSTTPRWRTGWRWSCASTARTRSSRAWRSQTWTT
mmetsp:Transcript_4215/g.10752  ORF Transcript_4215/g.10752 Transcript_4215/m.10752 type:complete len:218 (+) Transcript_4215:1232-1885(+)